MATKGPARKEGALRRNPEYIRQKTNRWRAKNPDKFEASQKKSESVRTTAYRKDPAYYLWRTAKVRAKALGVPFEITVEDVVLPDLCPILQVPINVLASDWQSGASLDKVDNTLGYIPGNVRVISRKANRLKADATLEQIERIAMYMRGDI